MPRPVTLSSMTLTEFRATLTGDRPPDDVAPLARALWHDAKGQWEDAHRIAQDVDSRLGAWVHAYLHRKEGDLGNARYWYRRALQEEATDSLAAEWHRIVTVLLEA
jgi:hypothetical protein